MVEKQTSKAESTKIYYLNKCGTFNLVSKQIVHTNDFRQRSIISALLNIKGMIIHSSVHVSSLHPPVYLHALTQT